MKDLQYSVEIAPLFLPQGLDGQTEVHSDIIDSMKVNEARLVLMVSAVEGTPTSYDLHVKVYESDTLAQEDFVQVTALDLHVADTDGAGVYTMMIEDLDVLKRYLNIGLDIAFVDGTSPTLPIACFLELGNQDSEAVGDSVVHHEPGN